MSAFLEGLFLIIFAIGIIMMIGGFGWLIATTFTGATLIFVLGFYLTIISTGVAILLQEIGLLDD